MKNTICIVIFLSLLVATITPATLAQDQPENQTIDVIGTGRIRGGNISGARDEAISDCLVTAISIIAMDMLQKQVVIQSFQDINRLLFSGADQFVQDYKVLTEDNSGRVYRVMVQATVSVDKIRELLIQKEILSKNTTPLKVLLLIAEQGLEDELFAYWWRSAHTETIFGTPPASAPAEQEFPVDDHSRPWPLADDSDTIVETPLSSEMTKSRTTVISEAPLAGALTERGFLVVDHNRLWPLAGGSDTLVDIPPDREVSDNETTTISETPLAGDFDTLTDPPPGPEMSNSQAAALGAQFQADVVVVGTGTVRKASNVLGNELRSFEGALSVRAIRTDTEAILSEITHTFITADADDLEGSHRALSEVGAQTGELLSGQITAAWQQTIEEGPTTATVVVEGSFQLSHLVAFRRTLSGMPGVSGLQIRGMTPEETMLSLDYDGTTQELAEALLLNSFAGFGVHISEATTDTVRLSLVSD